MITLNEVAKRYHPSALVHEVSPENPETYSCDVCSNMMIRLGTPVHTYVINAPMGDAVHLCTSCHNHLRPVPI
jgi:hypothetical protein